MEYPSIVVSIITLVAVIILFLVVYRILKTTSELSQQLQQAEDKKRKINRSNTLAIVGLVLTGIGLLMTILKWLTESNVAEASAIFWLK